ncbi:MAG: carbohydrate ABC transporter permease [Propionibacteriaceae bacterium]|jgi:raffinose/stachyose/melibiose transport system permease protein|nr:carbohydrate ABC transporter permease [Propionibacteriaceae bacterium]
MTRHAARRRPAVLGATFAWIWLLIIIVPIYYMILSSLRTQGDYYAANPLVPPASPSLRAYKLVIENDFLRYLGNSLIITVVSVVVLLVVAVMASYAIARGRHKASLRIFRVVLLGLAIPAQATIVPLYYMILQMKLYDTLIALILPSIGFGIPITVLILVNFIRDIPSELFESMTVDGGGSWRTLWSLVLPLTRPALITVGIYDALQVWNGFLFPLVLTGKASVRVLPYSLFTYQGEHGSDTPAILAAVVLSSLPILAAYIVGRRQLIAGLTAGFGK